MRVLGVIPARMKSSRFPGKPLADIHGIPMVGHCYFRSLLAESLDDVWVATCDVEVEEYVRSVGGKVVMTRSDHEMCTDRVVEATAKIEELTGKAYDIVINVQGDQPLVMPETIDSLVAEVKADEAVQIATVMAPITTDEAHRDPNRIKIVTDLRGNAMYMSREPIPSPAKYDGKLPRFVHVALIAFRRNFLDVFGRLPMSPLERVESVDYLRAMENGYAVRMVQTELETETVDNERDLQVVRSMFSKDPLVSKYSHRRGIDMPAKVFEP